MKLSIIVPCFNEERTVLSIVTAIRRISVSTEIICVDDCSTDNTGALLKELLESGQIEHLHVHAVNKGKGQAIRSGLQYVSGEIIAIQDADLEYNPAELPRLILPIVEGKADAVFGSRFRGGQPGRVLYFWHRVGNGFLTLLSNMMTNLNLSDMETCYKIIRSDLFKQLPTRSCRFGIEPELTALLAASGARIYEMGIGYDGRTYAEGKKIGWRDGIAAVWTIIASKVSARRTKDLARSLRDFRAT